MLSLKVKDLKLRHKYSSVEQKKLVLKVVFIHLLHSCNNNFLLFKPYLQFLILKTFRKFKLISKTRFKSVCILTNRTRSVNFKFGLSRLELRRMFQFGMIPGYRKAVW